MNSSQLYWQCRRGSLELDLLLRRYLENDYPSATEQKRQQFVELLKLEDDDLLPALHIFKVL
ncbi:MAG: succinate dehydrogenase assembly factor 2 [Methylococcales bacterium]|nr:succinate dehydrogenase assembly factor 2 [Methylococcales bacterium]